MTRRVPLNRDQQGALAAAQEAETNCHPDLLSALHSGLATIAPAEEVPTLIGPNGTPLATTGPSVP